MLVTTVFSILFQKSYKYRHTNSTTYIYSTCTHVVVFTIYGKTIATPLSSGNKKYPLHYFYRVLFYSWILSCKSKIINTCRQIYIYIYSSFVIQRDLLDLSITNLPITNTSTTLIPIPPLTPTDSQYPCTTRLPNNTNSHR